MDRTNHTKRLRIAQAAERLSVSTSTIRSLLAKGEFPNTIRTPGGHARLDEAEVEAFIAAQKQPEPSVPAAVEGGAA
jgi:excisionase family DNA binding protein